MASSAMSDRSTGARLKARWSARLSMSSASVRSIARGVDGVEAVDELAGVAVQVLARATSRRVWVIASGVRSSWEALAANRCCSATWASSRASMASKLSASSRNSSLRPGSRIRWESDPSAASAGGVGDACQGGEHAAGEQPPSHETEHHQEPQHEGRDRSEAAQEGGVAAHDEDHPRVHTTREGEVPGDEQHGAGDHEETGVAEGELEANAQTRDVYPPSPPSGSVPGCVSMR